MRPVCRQNDSAKYDNTEPTDFVIHVIRHLLKIVGLQCRVVLTLPNHLCCRPANSHHFPKTAVRSVRTHPVTNHMAFIGSTLWDHIPKHSKEAKFEYLADNTFKIVS